MNAATETVRREARRRAARALLAYVDKLDAERARDLLDAVHALEVAELVLRRTRSQAQAAERLAQRTRAA